MPNIKTVVDFPDVSDPCAYLAISVRDDGSNHQSSIIQEGPGPLQALNLTPWCALHLIALKREDTNKEILN